MIHYTLVFFILLLIELAYFRVAIFMKINDKPNLRSSHTNPTILGGGIIFYVAILLFWLLNGFQYSLFFIGLSFITLVSFIDDLHPQSYKVRLLAQLTAVILMLVEMKILTSTSLVAASMIAILSVGVLNAYNFMDGINGMLGILSLVVALSLLYINTAIVPFIEETFIVYLILSLLVFGFFNFRKKARCFSGDVGSIALGLISLFMLGKLMITTGNFVWIGLITLFGIDSSLTIIHRIFLHENITLPHRKHLFQIAVNELGMPQVGISIIYALAQLFITIGLILLRNYQLYAWLFLVSCVLVLCVIYYFSIKKYFGLHQSTSTFPTSSSIHKT